ncbi:hypothetical protein [Streptomyces similanensis]|uniref:hypothetical protein n=1 Tax=Streptomyces similanensis TaxID=1274988 RepID=UPI0031E92078
MRRSPCPQGGRLSPTPPTTFWLDDALRAKATPTLTGSATCGLLVVGGGHTGL